jgi:dUTP pyrophosphatase
MNGEERAVLRFRRMRPEARVPARATAGATGYDVFACLETGMLEVGADPVRVPTGIAVEAPPGCDVQLRPRSGLSAQGVMATFGTLDPDYRGELFVTLYTVGSRGPHLVRDGDRVAQLVVVRALAIDWQESEELSASERGAGGHGSTGR